MVRLVGPLALSVGLAAACAHAEPPSKLRTSALRPLERRGEDPTVLRALYAGLGTPGRRVELDHTLDDGSQLLNAAAGLALVRQGALSTDRGESRGLVTLGCRALDRVEDLSLRAAPRVRGGRSFCLLRPVSSRYDPRTQRAARRALAAWRDGDDGTARQHLRHIARELAVLAAPPPRRMPLDPSTETDAFVTGVLLQLAGYEAVVVTGPLKPSLAEEAATTYRRLSRRVGVPTARYAMRSRGPNPS